MSVHVYTSFSFSYLNRARVLAASLKRYHPDWVLWAVLTDKKPEGCTVDWENEEFDHLITAEQLFGEKTEAWLFGHDVVEACTAVKGAAMLKILEDTTCKKLIYFDPDITIFNKMTDVVKLLDEYSILLTPHQTDPEPKEQKSAIMDNELASLNYGVFNLGFVAVLNDDEGRRFAGWWADRLFDWCHDRLDIGVFVDQKWCNLVPCFFDRVKVLRDPGLNVASWNISQRHLSFDKKGRALINGDLLKFYHFTKLGRIGDTMTQRYARGNTEVYELWFWYSNAVRAATEPSIPQGYWYYGTFDNNVSIPKKARELYRTRRDLQQAFSEPRKTLNGFFDWFQTEENSLN